MYLDVKRLIATKRFSFSRDVTANFLFLIALYIKLF